MKQNVTMRIKAGYGWGAVALVVGAGLLVVYNGWQPAVQVETEQAAVLHQNDLEDDQAWARPAAGLAQTRPIEARASTRGLTDWRAERFASSLRGTEIDGQLMADAEGNLIIDSAIKDFFDYFLTAVGEVSEVDALAEIERLAMASLPPAAVEQALQLLRDYLAYQHAQQDYLEQPLAMPRPRDAAEYADQLAATFEDLKRLRRHYLGEAAADAFFAMEEAYGDYTVEAIRIQTDAGLNAGQKAGLLQAKARELPAPLREVKLRQIEEDRRAEAGLEALNSAHSEEDLRQRLSNAGFSAQKTEELVAFWHHDRQFQQRYAQYQVERQQVLAAGLARADQDRAMERLRLRHFESRQDQMRARMRDLGQ